MENKNATGATNVKTVTKTTKPRQPPITYKEVKKVEDLVRAGKGTIEELVSAGVEERKAKIAIKKLKAEGIAKESIVIVQ